MTKEEEKEKKLFKQTQATLELLRISFEIANVQPDIQLSATLNYMLHILKKIGIPEQRLNHIAYLINEACEEFVPDLEDTQK